MKNKILVMILIFTAKLVFADPPVEKGKEIFINRCAACHNVNKTLTGPALSGLHERRSMDWIVSFIRSSQTMVKNGDKTAVQVFEKFNKIPMPDHPDLTDENIWDIVEFIKAESKPVNVSEVPFDRPAKKRPNYQPLSITEDYNFFIGFFLTVGLLVMVLLFAVQVAELKRKTSQQVPATTNEL